MRIDEVDETEDDNYYKYYYEWYIPGCWVDYYEFESMLFLNRVDKVDEHDIPSRRSQWGLMMMIVIVVCCYRKSLWFKLKSSSRAFDEYTICRSCWLSFFIAIHFLEENVPPSKDLSMSIQLVVLLFFNGVIILFLFFW